MVQTKSASDLTYLATFDITEDFSPHHSFSSLGSQIPHYWSVSPFLHSFPSLSLCEVPTQPWLLNIAGMQFLVLVSSLRFFFALALCSFISSHGLKCNLCNWWLRNLFTPAGPCHWTPDSCIQLPVQYFSVNIERISSTPHIPNPTPDCPSQTCSYPPLKSLLVATPSFQLLRPKPRVTFHSFSFTLLI